MINRFLLLTETVAASFLLAIALLVALNVGLRGAFDISLPDWYDGSRLLLGVALSWGIAVTTFRGGHICVDALWEHCGVRGRRAIDLLAAGAVLLFFAPLAWMVWQKTLQTGTQATADLRLPVIGFYALAAAGMTAAALLAAVRLSYLARGVDLTQEANGSHGS